MEAYLCRFWLRSLLEKEKEKNKIRYNECHTKEKSYRSLGSFNLCALWSGGRGVGDRCGVRGLGLLDSNSGSSFGGRHYNNREINGNYKGNQ